MAPRPPTSSEADNRRVLVKALRVVMQGTRAWWEQKGRQAPSFNEGQNFLFIHLEMLFLQVNLFYVSPCVIGYFISHESTCVNTIFSGDILSAPKPSQSTGKKKSGNPHPRAAFRIVRGASKRAPPKDSSANPRAFCAPKSIATPRDQSHSGHPNQTTSAAHRG